MRNKFVIYRLKLICYRPISPDSQFAQEHFQEYLFTLFNPSSAKEVEKQCRSFVENLIKVRNRFCFYLIFCWKNQNEHIQIDELSTSVQYFYQTVKEFVLKIKPLPEEFKLSQFMTEIETYICVRGYPVLFGSRFGEKM